MPHVVLAGPGQLHRNTGHFLRDLDRLGDIIRAAAPSKTAAHKHGVELHGIRLQTGDLRRRTAGPCLRSA